MWAYVAVSATMLVSTVAMPATMSARSYRAFHVLKDISEAQLWKDSSEAQLMMLQTKAAVKVLSLTSPQQKSISSPAFALKDLNMSANSTRSAGVESKSSTKAIDHAGYSEWFSAHNMSNISIKGLKQAVMKKLPSNAAWHLPGIESMVKGAIRVLQDINAQASMLQARVSQKHAADEAKLARLKDVFVEQLRKQQILINETASSIADITAANHDLRCRNREIRQRGLRLRTNTTAMKQQLRVLESKLDVASPFTMDSLNTTQHETTDTVANSTAPSPADGNHRNLHADLGKPEFVDKEVQVLMSGEKRANKVDEGVGKTQNMLLQLGTNLEAKASALEFAAPASAANAGKRMHALLETLSQEVEKMSRKEQQSESKLRSLFSARFQQGTRLLKALQTHHEQLLKKNSVLMVHQSKLRSAEARFKDYHSQLENRIYRLQGFVARLSSNQSTLKSLKP